MTLAELLVHLQEIGVQRDADGGRLRVNAPKGRITPALEVQLVAHKEALLRHLAAPAPSAAPSLEPVVRTAGPLPLSFLQERLWMLDRLRPDASDYVIAALFTPAGNVDADRLAEAVRRTIVRHEILRARFVFTPDGPALALASAAETPVAVTDLRTLDAAVAQRALDAARADALREPFDLQRQAPVRFHIYRTPTGAALAIAAHHIALDAWSFGLLARDIGLHYQALSGAAPEPAPQLLQYADFAAWQRRLANHPSTLASLDYWKTQLAGLPQLSLFPVDRSADQPAGAAHDFTFAAETTAAIRSLAREGDATVYMVLLAAMAAVLSRHTGQTDLALGSPLGTREHTALEQVIGPILNPIAVRFDLSDDPTFVQVIARARDAVLEGHAHQQIPFERVVQELNPARSLQHSPLFQVAVVQHNTPGASNVQMAGGGAIYDVTLFVREDGPNLSGACEYRADRYDAWTIRRIVEHVEVLLRAAQSDRTRPISMLPLLGDDERTLITETFNRTAAPVARTTLVDQFADSVTRHRDRLAVVGSDGTLTYEQLDWRSTELAIRLHASGAERGSIVALAADGTTALTVSALGILKAGAAYLPVDLSYPAERVALMLADSGARHIVTTASRRSSIPPAIADAVVIVVDELAATAIGVRPAAADPAHAPRPDDAAYLIYTSGSTGKPKGVLVPHSAVVNFLAGMQATVGCSPGDGILAVTSPSFDISVLEHFLPLMHGARVIVADREDVAEGHRLAQRLATSGATMLQATPSGWRLLMQAGWLGDRSLTAIVGGEPLPPALAEWLRPRVGALWNAYGPTETTVWSTMARIEEHEPITIGAPIVNTRIYVLDRHRQPVPIGVAGEIYIAGDGVAIGYFNRPELTAERFVAEPGRSGRMYRTGDVGRWRADGRLEHLGRFDEQLKLRGYRIELGEIEARLVEHPDVTQAIVGVHGVPADDPRLVAWVQLAEDADTTVSGLRRHLRQHLPEFMVPSLIVPVDAMPLTANGKVDRRALALVVNPESGGVSAPPVTALQKTIAEIWSRLLGVPQVTLADLFFDLGGHSLLAMRAAHEIGQRTGRSVDPRLLFFRNLEQLAAALDSEVDVLVTTAP